MATEEEPPMRCVTAMVKPIAQTEKEKSLPQGDRLFI
tara:strand:- start:3191 stop:3301 length:111 start_codon:yes stop_codon:yes gene_type:complete